MANKNKGKPQVINNIQELNLEIDYDKLAEAIVKAQEKSEDEANKKKKYTSGTFATIISFAFRAVSVVGWLVAILVSVALVNIVPSLVWTGVGIIFSNVAAILLVLVLLIILALYSFLLWKSAKEIETEKDRNYIISVFSGIVSFAALIVALVALFKGVG